MKAAAAWPPLGSPAAKKGGGGAPTLARGARAAAPRGLRCRAAPATKRIAAPAAERPAAPPPKRLGYTNRDDQRLRSGPVALMPDTVR